MLYLKFQKDKSQPLACRSLHLKEFMKTNFPCKLMGLKQLN